MEFHDAANIFPMMTADEMAGLVDSILQGYDSQFPILTYEEKILDGRNRYVACLKAGVEPIYEEWVGTDPVGFVVRANLTRRHLSETQRAIAAGKIETMRHGGDRQDANLHLAITREKAAEMLNVSPRTVATVKAVERDAPDLLPKMEAGEMTANKAVQIMRKRQVVAELENIEAQEAKAIQGVYDVLVIDPPWPMQKIERDVAPNQVAFEYPTMTEEELNSLNIPAADNCHVWLWTTHKFLPMAFRLLDKWGMKYVCEFVWHKPGGFQPFGLPQYNCEFALYARKGTPEFIDFKDFMTCFNAPRGAHSEKPEEFYDTVRRVTTGRRLDMFSRRNIIGFDGWGKESCQ